MTSRLWSYRSRQRRAEPRRDLGDEDVDRGLVPHIERADMRLRPEGRRGGFGQRIAAPAARSDGDPEARGGKRPRGGEADAGEAPGDDGGFSFFRMVFEKYLGYSSRTERLGDKGSLVRIPFYYIDFLFI